MELVTCQLCGKTFTRCYACTANDNGIVGERGAVINLGTAAGSQGDGTRCHGQRIATVCRVIAHTDGAHLHGKSEHIIAGIPQHMGDVRNGIAPRQTTVHTVLDGVNDIAAYARGGCHGPQGCAIVHLGDRSVGGTMQCDR